MKHVRTDFKFYNLDTSKKQIDVNFIDLDSNLVDLNYKVASLIFCLFWRSIDISIISVYQARVPGHVASMKNHKRNSFLVTKLYLGNRICLCDCV